MITVIILLIFGCFFGLFWIEFLYLKAVKQRAREALLRSLFPQRKKCQRECLFFTPELEMDLKELEELEQRLCREFENLKEVLMEKEV